MKHTAAPWRWLDDQTLVGDHGRRPVVLSAGVPFALWPFDPDSPDGRLIQAAPKLLQAAKNVNVLYAKLHAAMPGIVGTPAYDIVTRAVQQAREAIAEVEGGP